MRTSAISARTCCGYADIQNPPTSGPSAGMWALYLGDAHKCARLKHVGPLPSFAFETHGPSQTHKYAKFSGDSVGGSRMVVELFM